MSAARPDRAYRHWYKSENKGCVNVRIAAQRWIAWLAEEGRITRGQLTLLGELAKHIDGKATTQKTIAFLAKRCRVAERTIQTWLRELAPSKALNLEGWKDRILTRRFMHVVGDRGKADNAPSWFTLEIPERFLAPAPRGRKAAGAAPARPLPRSPGGVEKITQAVIKGSVRVELSESLRPSGSLGAPEKGPEPSPTPAAARANQEAASPPQGPPSGGPPLPPDRSSLVEFAAKLFPAQAPVAHLAVERLEAVGLTPDQIRATLRRAARDPSITGSGKRGPHAVHPLYTAVWRVEHALHTVPRPSHVQAPPEPAERPPARRTRSPAELAEFDRIAEGAALVSQARTQTGRVTRPGVNSGGAADADDEPKDDES